MIQIKISLTEFIKVDILVISCFPFAVSLNSIMKVDDFTAADYIFVIFTAIPTLIFLTLLAVQPQSNDLESFKVPLVPLLPALSILINIYLMLELDIWTWIRFVVWIAIGEFDC